MAESHKTLPLLPPYELPPAYSRTSLLLAPSLPSSQTHSNPPPDSPPSGHDSLALAGPSSALPGYTAIDETSGSFELLAPLIHVRSSNGETRPRYHISQELTRSGKPWRLKIRRVLPTESRLLSSPTNTSLSKVQAIDYDNDTTLYMIEDRGALSMFKSRSVEIRGRRANTLPGMINIDIGGRYTGSCEYWHTKKKSANSLMNGEKMQKYGYHASDDWKKTKLFSTNFRLGTRKIGWKDKNGKTVALEEGGNFQVMSGLDQRTKDALITCFVAQKWASGKLNWTSIAMMDDTS
ncbi:hypothetical protein FKW77_007410 [Venturia effusa]|uniref:Uncharacterized protein n=1 Tax=Venturia effusa TaxID=50376 RepID=A0A517L5P7_9PEZI|nr:hypothetical protein FKW77_007410 [Venturia effusa]